MREALNKKNGNGGHWNVFRVITDEHMQQSTIYKLPIRKDTDLMNKNINNYSLIIDCGLPTLSYYRSNPYYGTPAIEAEDLNSTNADGLFVSPNTMRGYPTGKSVIIKMLEGETIPAEKYSIIEKNIPEFAMDNLTKEKLTKLDELIFAIGAEAKLYENKIITISNLTLFLEAAKKDMMKASIMNIELFSDAFFFRVKESSNTIEYKIADFDCIIHHSSKVSYDKLNNGNWSYFTTSLREFIRYFVVKEKQEEYLAVIK